MFWALDEAGRKIQATPRTRHGTCPVCSEPVHAKCGDINLWHFAHKAFHDCDTWGEPEGPWHLAWKSLVPENMREYVIRRTVETEQGDEVWTHRADIMNSRGTVVELQHSRISPADIRERESFYIHMVWLFDLTAEPFSVGGRNPKKFHLTRSSIDGYHDFAWKHPRRYFESIKKPLFVDFGDRDHIFQIKRLYPSRPATGNGQWLDKESFKKLLFV